MTGATAARGLFFGDDHCAFRLAGVAEFHRNAIGRIDLEKMVNALAKHAAFQSLAHHVGCEYVRDIFEKVAGVLLALDAHAEFAEAIDPTPYRRARHAYLAGYPRATHDNRRVFGEKVQQRCNAAVGRAREGLLDGSLGHEKREV